MTDACDPGRGKPARCGWLFLVAHFAFAPVGLPVASKLLSEKSRLHRFDDSVLSIAHFSLQQALVSRT